MARTDLLALRPEGLYCAAGDFFVDPWLPVERAVITHAHADHARPGHKTYFAHRDSEHILRKRLGADISLTTADYGQTVSRGDTTVSLHPAGHVLGSSQVRVEHAGEVWVVSGDYKLHADPTCTPFEPVRCSVFITEATFGLPIYRWPSNETIATEINDWWRDNASQGRPSVIYAYAFGKAQRILATVDPSIGPLLVHGAVDAITEHYVAANVALPKTMHATSTFVTPRIISQALVVAPPSAAGTPWLKRFKKYSDAAASGWMQVRGTRRRRNVDRGFVMSDHADFQELNQAIEATGAERVLVTHGSTNVLARWLTERGFQSEVLPTEFGDDAHEEDAAL